MTPPKTPDCNSDAMASFAAPHGSAKFTSQGGGRVIEWKGGSVCVWRGATDDGTKALAVKMTHPSGNVHKFLLTENGACALAALLDEALSPNDKAERLPDKKL